MSQTEPEKDAESQITLVGEYKEIVAGIFACSSLLTSIVAMIASQTGLVIGSGICLAFTGPYAYVQQRKLTDIETLKEIHEEVEREVNRLSAENKLLGKSVAELGGTVDELEHVEQCLDVITQTQTQSKNTFAEQVAENREILARMRKTLKASIYRNVLSVIILSDGNGSMTIEEDEIDGLIQRIRDINGVLIDEDSFRNAILRNGGSLEEIYHIIKGFIAGNQESEIIKIAD